MHGSGDPAGDSGVPGGGSGGPGDGSGGPTRGGTPRGGHCTSVTDLRCFEVLFTCFSEGFWGDSGGKTASF